MSKKVVFIISLAIVCISLILIVAYNLGYNGIAKNSENQPQNGSPDLPEGPEFVIPESPIGTLGLISALVAAFWMFAIANKRKIGRKLTVINALWL